MHGKQKKQRDQFEKADQEASKKKARKAEKKASTLKVKRIKHIHKGHISTTKRVENLGTAMGRALMRMVSEEGQLERIEPSKAIKEGLVYTKKNLQSFLDEQGFLLVQARPNRPTKPPKWSAREKRVLSARHHFATICAEFGRKHHPIYTRNATTRDEFEAILVEAIALVAKSDWGEHELRIVIDKERLLSKNGMLAELREMMESAKGQGAYSRSLERYRRLANGPMGIRLGMPITVDQVYLTIEEATSLTRLATGSISA